MSDLLNLTRPFKPNLVKAPPQGKHGSYVPHDIVTQKLLAELGAFNMSVGDWQYGEGGIIEGGVVTLTVVIDGEPVVIEEIGDCEFPKQKPTQGARMKDVASDGIKRCAMRIGCGLHLWSGEDYFLHDYLKSKEAQDMVTPDKAAARGSIPPINAASPVAGYDQPLTPRVKPDA